MAESKEIQEIREMISGKPTRHLRAMIQSLHARKLIDGLVVPGRRKQIDTLIGLILDELKERGDYP